MPVIADATVSGARRVVPVPPTLAGFDRAFAALAGLPAKAVSGDQRRLWIVARTLRARLAAGLLPTPGLLVAGDGPDFLYHPAQGRALAIDIAEATDRGLAGHWPGERRRDGGVRNGPEFDTAKGEVVALADLVFRAVQRSAQKLRGGARGTDATHEIVIYPSTRRTCLDRRRALDLLARFVARRSLTLADRSGDRVLFHVLFWDVVFFDVFGERRRLPAAQEAERWVSSPPPRSTSRTEYPRAATQGTWEEAFD